MSIEVECVLSNGAILDVLGAHLKVKPGDDMFAREKLSPPLKFMFAVAATNNGVPYVSSPVTNSASKILAWWRFPLSECSLVSVLVGLVSTVLVSCLLPYHTIPYHTILGRHGQDLPQTTLRPIKMAKCTRPAQMGRKGGGVSKCSWCAATVTIAGSACVICARDKEWRLKNLLPIILRVRPVR